MPPPPPPTPQNDRQVALTILKYIPVNVFWWVEAVVPLK